MSLHREGGIPPEIPAISSEKPAADLETQVIDLRRRIDASRQILAENPSPTLIYATPSLVILEMNRAAFAKYGPLVTPEKPLTALDLFFDPQGNVSLEEDLLYSSARVGPLAVRGGERKETTVTLVSFPFDYEDRQARLMMIQEETATSVAEDAARASDERYRELFENASDVIFVADLLGEVLSINRAAEQLSGYSRAEVLGHNLDRLLAPSSRQVIHDLIRAHLGGSATQHYELPVVTKDGSERVLEASIRLLYRNGHPFAIQGIGRDVTERKQAQERLEESSRQLQGRNQELRTALRIAVEATQLKEQFLANTSHELRTPMNGILGMVNLLLDTNLTPTQRECAEAVNQCANDLLTIINDILDVSQIEAGHLALNDSIFELHDSLLAVVKILALRARAKNLKLTYTIDPRLPPKLIGDSVRIRQILTNLIANAIKFTADGGVEIHLYAVNNPQRLRCEVVDSGIGVEDGARSRIFDAFVQADGSTRRQFGGTGLGLTISKQLVELMDGEIGTFNNEGSGSTFWFELPLRVDESQHAIAETVGE